MASVAWAIVGAGVLVGCGVSKKKPEAASFIRSLRQVSADGSTTGVASRDLTAFQRLIGGRTVPVRGGPKVEEVVAFEANVPGGQGDEGAYMAVVRAQGTAQLLYFEQVNHKPRTDRYFHRELSAAEESDVLAFLHAHSLASLRPAKSSVTTAPATQIGLRNSDPMGGNEEAQPSAPPVIFRVTDAHVDGALTVEFPTPAAGANPQGDLVKLMSKLRDAGELADPGSAAASTEKGLVCTYVQTVPPTATLVYADPFRKVERVWADGGDVRAVISPRTPPATEPAEDVQAWVALKGGEWVKSSMPEPATQPAPARPAAAAGDARPAPTGAVVPQDLQGSAIAATPAASEPARGAAPATEPSRFSNPNMLPTEEFWTAEPRGTFTAVSHYMPMNEYQSQQVEFWVPTFQFDDEHMWVDEAHGLIYLIHEGALFVLPVPANAMMAR